MEIKGKEIIAAEGKYIHRKGDSAYFKRCTLLKDETEANFEEVDSIPEQPAENTALKSVTEEKVKAMFFAKHISEDINTFGLSNNEALAVMDLHPEWKKDAGEITQGERWKCDGHLWECLQTHTAQENWKPSIYTSSIWKIVEEEHEGTESDPIPYTPPMEIFENKYYIQSGIKYRCTRSSGIPLSHDLASLVGTYVEVVE